MKLTIVGSAHHSELSTELEYAHAQMQRLLPRGTLFTQTEATSFEALIAIARREVDRFSLGHDDLILLLRNPFLSWTPVTLNRLVDAFQTGRTAAVSYDSRNPNFSHPPDYLTLRGLERYLDSLAKAVSNTEIDPNVFHAMVLTSAGNLRTDSWHNTMAAVPGAYAHDFSNYHQGNREDVLPFVDKSTRRILDVGGGEGGFLELVKREIGCETHLAEYSPSACAIARPKVDQVWQGDFLSQEFDTQFDCITFLDVLEHTTWPDKWLQKASALLSPGGRIIAAIPNVGHWSVVADLIEGRWDYAAAGIHCITHLRFFTRVGIERLMRESSLDRLTLHCHRIDPPSWFNLSSLSTSLCVDQDSLSTYAFIVVAKPKQ